jgi:membrane protein required for beta-lactamase induction
MGCETAALMDLMMLLIGADIGIWSADIGIWNMVRSYQKNSIIRTIRATIPQLTPFA